MPSSSVSLRARSSSVPPTAVMPIALITGMALGIGWFFLSLRDEAYSYYRYATSSGKTDTHISSNCHYLPFYLGYHARRARPGETGSAFENKKTCTGNSSAELILCIWFGICPEHLRTLLCLYLFPLICTRWRDSCLLVRHEFVHLSVSMSSLRIRKEGRLPQKKGSSISINSSSNRRKKGVRGNVYPRNSCRPLLNSTQTMMQACKLWHWRSMG